MRTHEISVWALRLLCSGFFAVTFLQSGLDKVFDRPGNVAYFKQVFEKSALKRLSGLLLVLLTALEMLTGAVNAAGFLTSFTGQTVLGAMGAGLAALTVLSLFAGQRLAKDYAGAAGAVPYFLTALFAVYVYGLR